MIIVASLFNLAGPDLLIILLIVLVLFGPKKLPELARGWGQAMREFTKAKDEIEREITKAEVAVQPPVGQQPYRPAELPPVPVAAAAAPLSPEAVSQAASVPLAQAVPPVEEPKQVAAHS